MTTRKTALITGANKRLGREIARQLGQKNHTVWLGCRDAERGDKAAADLRAEGLHAHAIRLDVTSDASVKEAAAIFRKASPKLDVLVNNAGVAIGGWGPPSQASLDDMRAIYEVNTFGPVRVTQAFLSLLITSGQGRIVMMSSTLGSIEAQLDMTSETYGVSLLAYNSSKTALNMITVLFAKELSAHGIKVNAANPGYTATRGRISTTTTGTAAWRRGRRSPSGSPRSGRWARPRASSTTATSTISAAGTRGDSVATASSTKPRGQLLEEGGGPRARRFLRDGHRRYLTATRR